MRDFVKTSKFVERFNHLVNDVQTCVFADARPNEYYTQHMYMLHGDDAFGMGQQTMGDVEIEAFTEATDRLKSELPDIVAELVELCPSLREMPLYFAVWQRILAGMKAPTNEWWEERMYEEFWANKGVCDACTQLGCTVAVIGLHAVKDATRQTIEDVRQKYSLKGDQEAENKDAEQHAKVDKIINDALNNTELIRIFHDDVRELTNYIKGCVYARNDSQRKRIASELVKRKIIYNEDVNKSLYSVLDEMGIIHCSPSTWRGA